MILDSYEIYKKFIEIDGKLDKIEKDLIDMKILLDNVKTKYLNKGEN